jgi:hypothetical protein
MSHQLSLEMLAGPPKGIQWNAHQSHDVGEVAAIRPLSPACRRPGTVVRAGVPDCRGRPGPDRLHRPGGSGSLRPFAGTGRRVAVFGYRRLLPAGRTQRDAGRLEPRRRAGIVGRSATAHAKSSPSWRRHIRFRRQLQMTVVCRFCYHCECHQAGSILFSQIVRHMRLANLSPTDPPESNDSSGPDNRQKRIPKWIGWAFWLVVLIVLILLVLAPIWG